MPTLAATDLRWRALLSDFQRGGLTHAEFCRQREISIHSFRNRLYDQKAIAARIERNGTATRPEPTRFLPVNLGPTTPLPPVSGHDPLTLVLAGGRRLAVGTGF